MFDVYCPQHHAQVLLGARSVEHLEASDHGVELHWRCHCGARGVLTLRTADETAVAA